MQSKLIDEFEDENNPFIYNNNLDVSNIKNIVLIDDTVSNYNIFVDGCNEESFPILYNNRSNKGDLVNIFKLFQVNQLNRIVFIFHNIYNGPKKFINDELFFNEIDMLNSNNVQFLIDLINEYNIKNVDFLACSSLQFDLWNQYFNILQTNTNAIIGASNDDTGNLKYGADWVMENTNQDIKDIYFNSFIDTYSDKLVTSVNILGSLTTNNNIFIKQLTNGNIYYSTTDNNDDNISTGTWTQINASADWTCVLLNNNATPTETNRLNIIFLTNITISNIDNYFLISTNFITINGNYKIFSVNNITNYPGLIRNGNGVDSAPSPSVVSSGYNNIVIQNLTLTSNNSTLRSFGGWVCQSYFGCSSSGVNNIINCINNAVITNGNSAGIVGHAGFMSSIGTNTISGCRNTGNISNFCGGITARRYGMASSAVFIISSCENYGNMTGGTTNGGICSYRTFEGSSNSTTLSNCINYGSIGTQTAGGITGQIHCFYSTGTNTITGCINNGPILGASAGGICGFFSFGNATLTSVNSIINCINTGVINTDNCGGICGESVFANSYGSNTISNCKNTGPVLGLNAGGIVGVDIGGTDSDYNSTFTVNIIHCYSLGTVGNSTTMGGLCGNIVDTNARALININNCYTLYGDIKIPNATPNNTNFNLSNTYTAYGTWSKTTALANLLMRVNNNYIWSYRKTNGVTDMTLPFELFALDLTTTPVGLSFVCFNKDTKILTNMGYIPIQDLRPGELIKTSLDGYKAINMIGCREICNTICDERIKDKLYVCSPDKYETVFEDLIITGCHSILVDNVSEIKKENIIKTLGRIYETDRKYRLPACVDERAQPYEIEGSFTIYHIALENENYYSNYGIYANGLLVESCSKRYLLELSEMSLIK